MNRKEKKNNKKGRGMVKVKKLLVKMFPINDNQELCAGVLGWAEQAMYSTRFLPWWNAGEQCARASSKCRSLLRRVGAASIWILFICSTMGPFFLPGCTK